MKNFDRYFNYVGTSASIISFIVWFKNSEYYYNMQHASQDTAFIIFLVSFSIFLYSVYRLVNAKIKSLKKNIVELEENQKQIQKQLKKLQKKPKADNDNYNIL